MDDFERRVRALTAAPGMTEDELEQTKEGILALAAQAAPPTAPVGMANLSAVLATRPAPIHPCHHCGNPATTQWQRAATPDEAEAHWAALEQNIRASNSGNPAVDYTHPRNDEVRKAVFGCPDHPDPAPGVLHQADCGGHGTCQCGEASDD